MSSVADKLATQVQPQDHRQAGAPAARLHRLLVGGEAVVPRRPSCFAVVSIVVTFLIYTVLSSTGIFEQVNSLVQDVAGSSGDLTRGARRPRQRHGLRVVAALLNLVVVTALGAIIAVLYNLSVKITGGLLVGFTNN